MTTRSARQAAALYLAIEALLDDHRRYGVPEEQIRLAIERAWRFSVSLSEFAQAAGASDRRIRI